MTVNSNLYCESEICASGKHFHNHNGTRVDYPERKAAHTPTPWRTLDAENGLLITASDADATPIAEMICKGEGCPEEADAAYIVRCVNAHQALVDALKLFAAMDKCNYELETMRRSGLFEQVDAALALAEGRSDES